MNLACSGGRNVRISFDHDPDLQPIASDDPDLVAPMVRLVLKLKIERQWSRLGQNQFGASRRAVADQAVGEPPPIATPQDAAPEARPVAVFPATIAGIGW